MRIYLFTDSFLPYISGVSSAVLNQANEMAARGHEVSIFHPRPKREDRTDSPPGLDPSIRTFGLPVSISVPNVPKLRFTIPLFVLTYLQFLKARPDLIHVHSEFGCGIEGVLLGRCLGIPIVGTFHTFFAEPEYLKQFRIPDFKITRKAMWKYSVTFYNRCRHIVSPSKSVRDHLVERGLKRPATLMSNGIDQIDFRSKEELEAARRLRGIDDFSFVYVGRISPEKSLDIVLKAFRQVVDANAKAKLVIVGNGPSDGMLDELTTELGLSDNIIRTGRIERDRLMKENIPLLGDVFVTASKTENQPVSLLEAMAFGLPMIGPRAKGIPQLVEDGVDGIIFEPDDVGGLVNAMRRLMEDRVLCREMSAAALRNANEHRIDKIGDELEAIYWKVVSESKG